MALLSEKSLLTNATSAACSGLQAAPAAAQNGWSKTTRPSTSHPKRFSGVQSAASVHMGKLILKLHSVERRADNETLSTLSWVPQGRQVKRCGAFSRPNLQISGSKAFCAKSELASKGEI